ncbi:MAG: DUF503 domain-containing protein [Clostridiales bacterium]|nr:DUF503 domain-containing protein [Clostridiales bacterium]
MIAGIMELTLYAPWVHSLKEKRMVVKGICGKAAAKFNISVAEVGSHDLHQTLTIGVACVTSDAAHCDSILDNVLRFIENNTEAEVVKVERAKENISWVK